MEPQAASPRARLEAVNCLNAAGVPTGVMVAPVIPGLTDHEMEAILEAAADAQARWAGYVLLRLPHEVKDLFREWLAAHYPDRANHVMSLVRQMRGGKDYDPAFGTPHARHGASGGTAARSLPGSLPAVQPGDRKAAAAEYGTVPAATFRPAARARPLARPGCRAEFLLGSGDALLRPWSSCDRRADRAPSRDTSVRIGSSREERNQIRWRSCHRFVQHAQPATLGHYTLHRASRHRRQRRGLEGSRRVSRRRHCPQSARPRRRPQSGGLGDARARTRHFRSSAAFRASSRFSPRKESDDVMVLPMELASGGDSAAPSRRGIPGDRAGAARGGGSPRICARARRRAPGPQAGERAVRQPWPGEARRLRDCRAVAGARCRAGSARGRRRTFALHVQSRAASRRARECCR